MNKKDEKFAPRYANLEPWQVNVIMAIIAPYYKPKGK